MKKYQIFGLSLLITLLFIGCGGNSSRNSTTQAQNESPKIGTVVDSQIIGLRYISTNKDKTQTTKGITNAKGEFKYFEDGKTEFFVGNIKIGATTPDDMVAITTLAKTEIESENIARFLQTIDEDSNPDNGIQISSSVDEHARSKNVSDLKFDTSFDTNFDSVKSELFKNTANIPETVTINQALNHANKSLRLSSLKEFDLYKAIANEKNYRGGNYYNADVFEKDQRKRVFLWIWEKLLSKEMAIEDELQFTKPEFDINNVEETRNQIKKYLDYADVVAGVASLGKETYENISKAGSRTFSYEITKLTSLTVNGCSTVVKLYDADTQELSDNDMCKDLMQVLNPVNASTSKLAVANPILSSFLPTVLPTLLHAKKMNWLHFNTKSLRTISKLKVSKIDVISIALSIASISNDFYGASWASDINEELTTRMVAREWLSLWFRSGFNQDYMNKLINNNSKEIIGRKEQIEAIALKLGSTGALCDTYEFFNPFYTCTGIESINYNYDKTVDIITEKLAKSNALYNNITKFTGPISNEKGQIGTIDFDWKDLLNPQDKGLIASYHFENNLTDSSDNKNNLIADNNTTTYIKGSKGYGIEINTIFSNNNLKDGNFSDGLTISLSVRSKQLNNGTVLKIFKDKNNNGHLSSSNFITLDVYYPSHSGWKYALGIGNQDTQGNGGYFKVFPSNEPSIEANKWYHIVYTVDNKGKVRDWYNGKEGIGAQIDNPTFLNWNLKDITLSIINDTGFSGSIDELKIYNRALSDKEIKNL